MKIKNLAQSGLTGPLGFGLETYFIELGADFIRTVHYTLLNCPRMVH